MSAPQKEIKIHFPEALRGGAYANHMTVTHTQEEFILDFLLAAPPAGAVTARIVVSPGHVKRILAALHENLRRYEARFGEIQQAEAPKGDFGLN